jgi:hypothetical protein
VQRIMRPGIDWKSYQPGRCVLRLQANPKGVSRPADPGDGEARAPLGRRRPSAPGPHSMEQTKGRPLLSEWTVLTCGSPGMGAQPVFRCSEKFFLSMPIPERISKLPYVVTPRGRSGMISRAPSEWSHPVASLPEGPTRPLG